MKLLLTKISVENDERAFKVLFDKYATRLFQFSYSFLKDKLLAEEAVSDVFFKVWLKRSELMNIENIKAYLFKATYNVSLNYLSEMKRKKAVSLEDVEVELGVDMVCPETEMINRELKKMIDRAIESLPPRCKLIYKMAKVENLRYKEIAELLDISVKTINHQLSIALKKIGEIIRKYLEENNSNKNAGILFALFVPSGDTANHNSSEWT